jgi:WD40 repeat protein
MIPPTSIDGTDITGATIDGTDVTEITVDGDVVFSAGPAVPDGTHYYLVDESITGVEHYQLTTTFDITSLGSPTSSINPAPNTSNIAISRDGALFYYAYGSSVEKLTLSTPFDLNSAGSPSTISGVTGGDATCLQIADGGRKVYASDGSGNIEQRTLSIPNDIATHGPVTATLAGEATNGPGDVAFNPNGTKLTFGHRSSGLIVTYDLSTAFDIGTASNKVTFDATADSGDADPSCLKWNGDGTEAFVRHASPDMVNKFTTTTAYSVSGMSFDSQLFNNAGFASGGHDFNVAY